MSAAPRILNEDCPSLCRTERPELVFSEPLNNGVSDFDIMGFSYYYAWHQKSIGRAWQRSETLKQPILDTK